MPDPTLHTSVSADRCLRFFVRARCSCGWRTWPRRSARAAGAVLSRHMRLAAEADTRTWP